MNPHPASIERLEPRRLFSAGDPDLTFGVAGSAAVPKPDEYDQPRLISVTRDGGILIAGADQDRGGGGWVTRLDATGRPDRFFGGGDGVAETSAFGVGLLATETSDGRILVLARPNFDVSDASVFRLLRDGRLDVGFGGKGDGAARLPASLAVNNVLPLPDGSTVVVGRVDSFGSTGRLQTDLGVCLLRPDGTLDRSFGDNGLFVGHIGPSVSYMPIGAAVAPDGKIVVASMTGIDSDSGELEVGVLRVTRDGRLDRSFSGDGVAIVRRPGGFHSVGNPLIDAAGRLVVPATDYSGNVTPFRLRADGALDRLYAVQRIGDEPGGGVYVMASRFASDGKLVISAARWSQFSDGNGFGLLRYRDDGTGDLTFGQSGLVRYERAEAEAGAILPDGRPIVMLGGWSETRVIRYDYASTPDRSTVRLLPDGTLTADGTPTSDYTYLWSGKERVWINYNGMTRSFARSAVKRVRLDLGGGDDNVDAAYQLDLPLDLRGGAGNDGLTGGAARDRLDGGPGNDTLRGASIVSFVGDVLIGGDGDDQLYGDAGRDELRGDAGDDRLFAGDGADRLFGGPGDDRLIAGAGDDWLDGGSGADDLSGGYGVDTLDYARRTTPLFIDLADFRPNDGAAGEADNALPDNEIVRGGSGNDTIRGSSAANVLYGFAGDDLLDGRDGDDTLIGGVGRDWLLGGAGKDLLRTRDNDRDRLNGGLGADRAERDLIDDVLSIESFID